MIDDFSGDNFDHKDLELSVVRTLAQS